MGGSRDGSKKVGRGQAPRLAGERREDTMAATQHHGRKSPTPASAPNLEISPLKVWFFIQKAREFDVKDVVTDEGSGSNAADDSNSSVLENHGDDPTYTELRMFINALTEDEQVDLVALTWLGRG